MIRRTTNTSYGVRAMFLLSLFVLSRRIVSLRKFYSLIIHKEPKTNANEILELQWRR